MVKFGWASRDITPQEPALVQGQKYVRVARKARNPLTATALAIEGESAADAVVWVSCDLTNIPGPLHREVRERLTGLLPNVPSAGVILSATHTHDGPTLQEGSYPHPGGDVLPVPEVRARVADLVAGVAADAWQSRTPRQLGRAFGHAVVGHNRRIVYADCTAQMYGDTDRPDFRHVEGYEDHSLDILAIWEPDGSLSGLVVDVPCPSQVEEHLEEWSADYWHDVRLALRRRFGEDLYVLPLCGAAGDQSPHFLLYGEQEEEMRRRRGVTEREEIARRIGQGVADAMACTEPDEGDDTFVHRARRLELPGRTVTPEEADWARDRLDHSIESGEDPDLWWPRRLRQVIECYEEERPMPDLPADVHVMRLGDAVVATNPFELYLDYGLRIKARSPAAQTIIAQLSGVRHRGAYLPTERAARGGHYGAHPVSAPTAGEGGRMLVEETLKMIREVWET